MGREKARKPREVQPAWRFPGQLTRMNPPGELYQRDGWWFVLGKSDMPRALALAPTRAGRAALRRLAPLYGGVVPPAAVVLEGFIQTGQVPFCSGPGQSRPVGIDLIKQNAGTLFPHATSTGVGARDILHVLHADGVFLLADDPSRALRMVITWPGDERGSTEWRFLDQMSRAEAVGEMAVNAAAVAVDGGDPTAIGAEAIRVADEALRRVGMVRG